MKTLIVNKGSKKKIITVSHGPASFITCQLLHINRNLSLYISRVPCIDGKNVRGRSGPGSMCEVRALCVIVCV